MQVLHERMLNISKIIENASINQYFVENCSENGAEDKERLAAQDQLVVQLGQHATTRSRHVAFLRHQSRSLSTKHQFFIQETGLEIIVSSVLFLFLK